MKFLLLLVSFSFGAKFEPTTVARELQSATLQAMVKAKNSNDILSLNLQIKSQGNLMRVCQIEMKEDLNPQNCFKIVELWERTFGRSSPMRSDLERTKSVILDKEAIKAYIQERRLAKSGTKNE